jgi:hypothetical protein
MTLLAHFWTIDVVSIGIDGEILIFSIQIDLGYVGLGEVVHPEVAPSADVVAPISVAVEGRAVIA